MEIDLDKRLSPAVVAGLFDMSASNVYQLVQRGVLRENDTYREGIRKLVEWYRDKATKRAGSVSEMAVIRRAELDRVRTIGGWYGIKKERCELVDKDLFGELAERHFRTLKEGLVALGRAYPEAVKDVDKLLYSLSDAGKALCNEGEQELQQFVSNQVQAMADLEEEARVKGADD